MVQIVVNDELAQAIIKAGPSATLVDSRGNTIGRIIPLQSESAPPPGISEADWTELNRRMANPGDYVPFQQIKECLGW